MTSTSPADDIAAHNAHLSSLGPVDPSLFPFSPLPAPTSSNAFCKLTAIRTGEGHAPKGLFTVPVVNEGDMFNAPCFAFLVEKKAEDGGVKRVMFELGVREATKFTSPRYQMIAQMWKFDAPPGAAASILTSNSIPLDSISNLILGHAHFDHFGNLADYPSSMSMLVGPGSHIGEELALEMDVPKEVIEGRTVRRLSREEDKWETVGSFKGFDYFGDGSFWVLDIPGHKVGHLGALVRTSVEPPVYYLLGSDAAHAITIITQSRPDKVGLWPESALDPSGSPEKLSSMHVDLAEAYNSMAKLRRMNEEKNVHVWIAHDRSMDLIMPKEDFIPLDGTLEEVEGFKKRNQLVD